MALYFKELDQKAGSIQSQPGTSPFTRSGRQRAEPLPPGIRLGEGKDVKRQSVARKKQPWEYVYPLCERGSSDVVTTCSEKTEF